MAAVQQLGQITVTLSYAEFRDYQLSLSVCPLASVQSQSLSRQARQTPAGLKFCGIS